MKDSLHHERTFILYESLKGNVCLYCDALHLNHFAENVLVIITMVRYVECEVPGGKERKHPAANSLRIGENHRRRSEVGG